MASGAQATLSEVGQFLKERSSHEPLQVRAGRMAGMPCIAMMRASSSCGVQACNGVLVRE